MQKWTKFENASMYQEVIRQKIVFNIILAFLDHLKSRIFFERAPSFLKISGSTRGMPIPPFLRFFALVFIY